MGTLSSGLPEQIADDEDLARFITQSGQYNTVTVKPSAFLPSKIEQETSVSRHGRDPLQQLWQLGLEAAGERKIYGAAIFKASAVRLAKLFVVADEPPLRHAVIRGWPSDSDPVEQKAKQLEAALILAREAGKLFVRQADAVC